MRSALSTVLLQACNTLDHNSSQQRAASQQLHTNMRKAIVSIVATAAKRQQYRPLAGATAVDKLD